MDIGHWYRYTSGLGLDIRVRVRVGPVKAHKGNEKPHADHSGCLDGLWHDPGYVGLRAKASVRAKGQASDKASLD